MKIGLRKKDKIKRRSKPIFILVHSLSLEKLIQLSNPTRIRFSLCIENSYKQSQSISVPTLEKETKAPNPRVFYEQEPKRNLLSQPTLRRECG